MIKLYYNDKRKRYYATVGYNCFFCQKPLVGGMIVHHHWGMLSQAHTYCFDCANKSRIQGKINSFVIAVIVSKLPSGSLIILNYDPLLRNSDNLTVWEAARPDSHKRMLSDAKGSEVIDRTLFADRDTFEGSLIGADVMSLLGEKDTPLTDIGAFLTVVKESMPLLGEHEIKLLNNKKKDDESMIFAKQHTIG